MSKQQPKTAQKRPATSKPLAPIVKNQKLSSNKAAIPPIERGCEVQGVVHSTDGRAFNVVLNQTNIANNNNKYYKIQLIKGDDGYWHVFKSWGRVGYNGQKSLQQYDTEEKAIQEFCRGYKDKTKNDWNSGTAFKKFPGKYVVVELDVTATVEHANEVSRAIEIVSKPSQLDMRLQNLLNLLFDINCMKQTLLDFNIDTNKMPLGLLSKQQLMNAYKVLTKIGTHLTKGLREEADPLVEASNQFYTLMPHDFGMRRAPVINNLAMLQQKRDMIDSLLQIEIAFGMIKTGDSQVKKENPIDSQYKAMNIKMEPVDHDSDDFQMIQQYMTNTHAPTHDNYNLELEEVFKVEREGESDRFKKFQKLKNRHLLWHGSRRSNFVGILSNGLKIAPKEAPVTGYMFGKGIYFADMVSKSANYCCTSPRDPTGLMLLSEVALGKSHELTESDYIEKLPRGTHSVKGIGKTQPDPSGFITRGETVVPMGKPITKPDLDSSLLYNEFIVYDTAQVKLQYLLKVKFNYKR